LLLEHHGLDYSNDQITVTPILDY